MQIKTKLDNFEQSVNKDWYHPVFDEILQKDIIRSDNSFGALKQFLMCIQ